MANLFGPYTYSGTDFSPGSDGKTRRSAFKLLTGSLGQIRVTVHGGFSTGSVIDHVSIGIGNGTFNDTTATPTEVTFAGGGHGVTLGAAASATSDWITFACASTDTIIVIVDFNASAGNVDHDTAVTDATGANIFTVTGTGASYATATFGGGTNTDFALWTITQIETQSGAAPAPIEGFRKGTIFTPGRGPARGLSRTQAFPSNDVSVNVPAAAGIGVARSILASVATGTLVQAAGIGTAGTLAGSISSTLAQAAGVGAAGSILPSVSGFLQQASGTGVAGSITVTGVDVADVVGMKQGFLFHPGAGPTWNIRSRWAFPPDIIAGVTTVNVPAVAGIGVAGALTPSVATGALAQAAGIGVAGSLSSTSSGSGNLTGVAGIGVAGIITAQDQAILSGAAGIGVSGSITGSVSVTLGQASGTGVAGGVTGQITGGNVNVNVPGVAGIGVAGQISFPPPPSTGGGNGGMGHPPRRRPPRAFTEEPKPNRKQRRKQAREQRHEAPAPAVPKISGGVVGDTGIELGRLIEARLAREAAALATEAARLETERSAREGRIAEATAATEARKARREAELEAQREAEKAEREADEEDVRLLMEQHEAAEGPVREQIESMLLDEIADLMAELD